MSKSHFILGIDPGLGGALALLPRPGACYEIKGSVPPVAPQIELFDMPTTHNGKGKLRVDPKALADIIGGICFSLPEGATIEAIVEEVGSRPRQAGAFNFGKSVGVIHGVLAGQGVPFSEVSPAVWKVAMGLQKRSPDETTDENKSRARAVASELFPAFTKQFSRKKDDGRAEALLLALYWANRRVK